MGGRWTVVQWDESHVFARQYNIWRVLAITEHGWLFGVVEDGPDGRIWIEMIEDRKEIRLQKLIKEYTATGTVVFTDSWKAYDRLSSNGREHYKVNHKEIFVSRQQRHRDEHEDV